MDQKNGNDGTQKRKTLYCSIHYSGDVLTTHSGFIAYEYAHFFSRAGSGDSSRYRTADSSCTRPEGILDSDLAKLYDVSTKSLIQAVKRHIDRFPEDFLFQLTEKEFQHLRSQIVTSSAGHGGRRFRPYVFTEQGVAMLSSVLHSKRAIQVNIEIMRAFVQLRRLLQTHAELSEKLAELEAKYLDHDEKFTAVFEAIRQLMMPPEVPKKGKIGSRTDSD